MAPSTKAIRGASIALAAALAPAVALFGFMVDDALISARVAHHLATGLGYRFNPSGPIVDAVTPLGWAALLAPFARAGPWAAFSAAKWLGLASWSAAAALLGAFASRLGIRALAITALALASSVPLAAWAVSGMETGLVTALCTAGLLRSRAAPWALGVAAALRPELLPWALTLSGGRAWLAPDFPGASARPARVGLAALAVLAPFVAVAVARVALFGQAFPLSLVAKPPDAALGARYALGALALSGPFWLLVAGRSYARASPLTRASALAVAVHALAVVYAGGDWMPFFRLFVPVLPGVLLAGAELAELGGTRALALRVAAMLVVSGAVGVTLGPSARAVGARRLAVIEAARPALDGARTIAALDVGWVGTASSANIIDLAGVTDPSIARLRGSHTAKRLPEGLLETRAVDAVVLFVEDADLERFPELTFVHPVEARLSTLLSFSEFRPVARIPLGGTTRSYVIARRSLGR